MEQDGNLHMLFVFKMTQRIKVLVRHSIPHSINQSMIIVVFESIILCISNSIQLKPNYIKTDMSNNYGGQHALINPREQ